MDSKRVAVLKTSFDDLSHLVAEEHIEYWLARVKNAQIVIARSECVTKMCYNY